MTPIAIRRRGAVILAVLVVVVLAALVGWGMLARADAQVASLLASTKRAQARAAAWSGIQAIMSKLAAQREEMLGGSAPTFDDEVEVFVAEGARGVARIVGKPEPEAARLNINAATPEMLVASRTLDQAQAKQIVAAAAEGPYGSEHDVLAIASDRRADETSATKEVIEKADEGATEISTLRHAGSMGWTAVSADANVQSGVIVGGPDSSSAGTPAGTSWIGQSRINLNAPWTDAIGQTLVARLGAPTAEIVKSVMGQGRRFGGMGAAISALRDAGLPPANWGTALDLLTTTEDGYLPGRVDLSTAPAPVLACVPGIGAENAEAIVAMRGQLDAVALRDVAWPVVRGVLPAERFIEAADWLTNRSLQWRVRIEAGIERNQNSSPAPAGFETVRRRAGGGSDSPASKGDGLPPLEGLVVYECVIDATSDRPRLAVLRDVTLEGPVRAWKALRARAEEVAEPMGEKVEELGSRAKTLDDTVERAGPETRFDEPGGSGASVPSVVGPPEPRPAEAGADRRVGRWRGVSSAVARPAK